MLSRQSIARGGHLLLLLAVCSACSSITGDLDLSPILRNAHHPGSDFTDADAVGPILSRVSYNDTTQFGVRPLFTTENRPWHDGENGARETVTSFIAPLGKYYSNPRTTQLRFAPLLWYTREITGAGGLDKDFLFFPILFFGSTTPPPGALAAGERADSYFALFPLFGQVNSFIGWDKFQFLGWPLLQRLTKNVYDDEESFYSIALLAGWTTGAPRGGSWRLLPLYSQSLWTYPPYRAPKYPEGADPSQPLPRYVKRSFLWPFVWHQRLYLDRGPEKESEVWAVFPLFRREKSFDRSFWTILWPFFRYNVEYPFKRESAQAAAEKVVPPEQADDPENTNVLIHFLTQLVFKYERTQEHLRRRVLLLVYADYTSLPMERKNRIDSTAILWPIGWWDRTATEIGPDGGYRDQSYFALTPIFQTHGRSYLDADGSEDGRSDRFTRIWPLFSYEANADGSRDIHALSILPLRISKFVKDFNDAWGVFFNIYRYERAADSDGGFSRHTALLNLIKIYNDDRESSVSIPVLYTGRSVQEDDVEKFSYRFLFGLFGYEGEDGPAGQSSRAIRLFWIPINTR